MATDLRYPRGRRRLVLVALCGAITATSALPVDAIEEGAAEAAEPRRASPLATELATATAAIRSLLAEEPIAGGRARDLFDIDISDAKVVDLERRRLGRLLAALEPSSAGASGAVENQRARAGSATQMDGEGGAGGEAGVESQLLHASPEELAARLELDRARYEFYQLPAAERARLLDVSDARPYTEGASSSDAQLTDAEGRARAAEEQRRQALEDARTARTEALGLVAEEQARLLQVEQRQADFEKSLVEARTSLARRKESVLAWHRRVREASVDGGGAEEFDRVYDELRTQLRGARDLLATALSEVNADSAVPAAGDERLGDLPDDVPAHGPRSKREVLERERLRLAVREAELRRDTLLAVYDEVVSLNHDRLALYPRLSPLRRSQIVGFGPAGIDQARAEARQVLLVLRHHLQATGQFIDALRTPGGARSQSALTATLTAFK